MQQLREMRDLRWQTTRDGVPTCWVEASGAHDLLAQLKNEVELPYRMLYDMTLIDERRREQRDPIEPRSEFTAVYHLYSFGRNEALRVKSGIEGAALRSITDLWPAANWYEREAWDMFGVRFDGHPGLRRILMPQGWEGHPLRKEHPARATDMPPFALPDERQERAERDLKFSPAEWGLEHHDNAELMFLNIGPQHPGTHGVLRLILVLRGEEIVDVVPDIGFHHRAQEKMAERQSWHSYIPYTDRVDYLGGVNNNIAYLRSVERLAGIIVPPRAQMIRIMLCELFRIASHLVWYGTFAQDVGALSPVFYMFTDRERILAIIEAVCGARMHPNWFRIGGVAQDLPRGWDGMVRALLDYLPRRLDEYDAMVLRNSIFKARTVGVGAFTLDEAIEWGITGPALRACGLAWDARRQLAYGGYDELEFDIPTATGGDCYARAVVRTQEMRQSLRIIEQCLEQMPGGPHKAEHPLAVPPDKERTLHDIETLIHHFLGVSWGPVLPPGESGLPVEGTKGLTSYYVVSDGSIQPYRCRIRAPSFAHMQMLPQMARGRMVADLLAILGAMDFVLAEVDR